MDGAKFQKVLPLDEEVQLINGWCDRKKQSPLRMNSFSGWPIPSGHPRGAYIEAMLAGLNRWGGGWGTAELKETGRVMETQCSKFSNTFQRVFLLIW